MNAVHSTVDFPKNICRECINKLESISLFIDISRKTNSYLEKNAFSIKVGEEPEEAIEEYDNERSRYCRACLSSSDLSPFEEKITLLQLFQKITKIDVRANTNDWNANSICSKCSNELEKASNFLSLSVSNVKLLETLATVDTRKEVLSTDHDGSFGSIVENNDLKVECTDKYTSSVIKVGIFDDGLDKSFESSMEANETKLLHNIIDIEEEILDNDDGSDKISQSSIDADEIKPINSIDIKKDILDNDFMFNCGRNDSELCIGTQIESKSSEKNQEQIEVCTTTVQQKSPKDKELQPIEGKTFKCDHCRKGFALKYNLKSYFRTFTEKKTFECEYCRKGFGQTSGLKTHLLTHTGEKPFTCDCCGRTFADKSTLRNHLFIHTGDGPFKCDCCGKKYIQKKSLQTHLLTHSEKKPVRCDYCDKRFTYNSELQRHLLTHTGEKLFNCDYCRKGFARKDILKTHLLTHSGEKRFNCDYCDKRFTWNSGLQRHLLTHTGEKPFNCDYCRKEFARKDKLKNHLLTHTGEKPFNCDYCDKRFICNSALQRHLLTHTEKTFNCDYCDKRFICNSNLQRHLLTHTGENHLTVITAAKDLLERTT